MEHSKKHTSDTQEKVSILGLGWLGLPLAKTLQKKGYEVTGSTTSSLRLMHLLNSKLNLRIIKVAKNIISGNWKRFVKDSRVLVIAIPPGGFKTKIEDYPYLIEQVAENCGPDQKVIFISSSSVYSKPFPDLITEESITDPIEDRPIAIVEAEHVIRQRFGKRATIVRLSGLYGEERHPGNFHKNNIPLKNPNGKVNLIHLDDCVKLIQLIIEKKCFGEVINGCTDLHPIRSAFFSKAALSIDLDPPVFDANESVVKKVICNQKSKDRLGMVYKHSDPESFLKNN